MLNAETPFPYVGSHALLNDMDLPAPQPTELVRIQWRREGFAMVAFPLRDGASGNKVVPADALVDATPLTGEEQREFHDLDRALFGRSLKTPKQKRLKARRDELKLRMVFGPMMERLLREARAKADRQKWAA
jgi:hypothetical protein